MNTENFISLNQLCTYYEVEISFFSSLNELGLIEIETIEHMPYIHHDRVGDIEKIIRMHHELGINIEGIDIVLNLLEKIEALQAELRAVKNRLGLYED